MRFLDKDPFTGLTSWFKYDPITKESTIYTEGDVEASLEWTKALQNDESYSKKGMKKEFWHYATIPNALYHKWTSEGLDWNDTKAIIRKIDAEAPYLKATTKKHI